MIDISNYAKEHSLSIVFEEQYRRLKSRLAVYDQEKRALSESTEKLQEAFDKITTMRISFWHKRRDIEEIERNLRIIKCKFEPLFTKAEMITPQLDDVCENFSYEKDRPKIVHKDDPIPTMDNGCCLLI